MSNAPFLFWKKCHLLILHTFSPKYNFLYSSWVSLMHSPNHKKIVVALRVEGNKGQEIYLHETWFYDAKSRGIFVDFQTSRIFLKLALWLLIKMWMVNEALYQVYTSKQFMDKTLQNGHSVYLSVPLPLVFLSSSPRSSKK